MIWWLILIAIVVLGLLIVGLDLEECPREIKGYNCKGSACDHSPETVHLAKEDVRRD